MSSSILPSYSFWISCHNVDWFLFLEWIINYFLYLSQFPLLPVFPVPPPNLPSLPHLHFPTMHSSFLLLLFFQKRAALPYVLISHDVSRCSKNRKLLFYYGRKMQPSRRKVFQNQLTVRDSPNSSSRKHL